MEQDIMSEVSLESLLSVREVIAKSHLWVSERLPEDQKLIAGFQEQFDYLPSDEMLWGIYQYVAIQSKCAQMAAPVDDTINSLRSMLGETPAEQTAFEQTIHLQAAGFLTCARFADCVGRAIEEKSNAADPS